MYLHYISTLYIYTIRIYTIYLHYISTLYIYTICIYTIYVFKFFKLL